MSDDFGTVNIRPGGQEREIEALRQQFQRLRGDVDAALRRLDAMTAQPSGATAPGNRPLVTPPVTPPLTPLVTPIAEPVTDHGTGTYAAPEREVAAAPSGAGRLLLMGLIGLAVLAGIGWLIWRASNDRKAKTPQVVEQPATTPATTGTDTVAPAATAPEPAAAASSIAIAPAVADYGTIRKGTRAVRQFVVTNSGRTPITIQIARSSCRCLYYDYVAKLTPKKKETVTVTVDGARAKAGALEENIAVSSKEDPNATGTLGVRAVIQ
jgi:hypothetical protein